MNIFKWGKVNHKKDQKIAAIAIGGSSAILFLILGINLLYEARYRPAIGMIILFLFSSFYIAIVCIKSEKFEISKMAKKIKRDIEKEDNMENDVKNHIK